MQAVFTHFQNELRHAHLFTLYKVRQKIVANKYPDLDEEDKEDIDKDKLGKLVYNLLNIF